jgi:hypothetical protein
LSYDRPHVSQTPYTRYALRFPVKLEVEYRATDTDAWATARTRNASLGGVFLDETTLAAGARIQMRLHLPHQLVEVGGVVRWQDGSGIGVQFDGLRAKDVWALNKFFESQS